MANANGFSFIVHALLLTAAGYSMTLLMAAVYRRLITAKAIVTWPITILLVLVASTAFSAIEVWSRDGKVVRGREYLRVEDALEGPGDVRAQRSGGGVNEHHPSSHDSGHDSGHR